MEKDKAFKPSVFRRLKGDKHSKFSIFARIKTGEKSSSLPLTQERRSVLIHLGEINEIQSTITSCMKGISTLYIKNEGSLKLSRRTLVLIGCETSNSSKEIAKAEQQVSSNHIIVQETDDLDTDIELAEMLEILGDEGQAMFDERKELNLRAEEEPHSLYVSTILHPRKKKVVQIPL